jgi:hypothetical protein
VLPSSPGPWLPPAPIRCLPARLLARSPTCLPATCLPALQIAYVAQDDTLLPTLTVEECIRYSAILRQATLAPQLQPGTPIRVAWPNLHARQCRAQAGPAIPAGKQSQKLSSKLCLPDLPVYCVPARRLHSATPEELQAAVQSVMAELGLLQVARSRVGGSSGIRGVSGGERRRWAGVGGCAGGCSNGQHQYALHGGCMAHTDT